MGDERKTGLTLPMPDMTLWRERADDGDCEALQVLAADNTLRRVGRVRRVTHPAVTGDGLVARDIVEITADDRELQEVEDALRTLCGQRYVRSAEDEERDRLVRECDQLRRQVRILEHAISSQLGAERAQAIAIDAAESSRRGYRMGLAALEEEESNA